MPSNEQAGLSVTLKRRESERYAGDGTWMVFHGTPREVQQAIHETFGFTETAADETLAETVLRAERVYRGQDSNKPRSLGAQPKKGPVDVVKEALGGEVIAVETTDDTPPFEPDPPKAPVEDPWADSEPEGDNNAGLGKGEVSTEKSLLDQIREAGSKLDLKMLWSQNRTEFERPEIKEAAAKRAKEVA